MTLMEPFRPIVDLRVHALLQEGCAEVSTIAKRALVHVLYDDMHTPMGATPVMVCMQRLATSMAQIYLGERAELDLPYPALPLDLAASIERNQRDEQ
jgi:CRISP-associated protein Cas1